MSISTVEIRAFSGPDLVELGSAGRPTIIRLNVGPKGDAGNAATVAVGTTTTGAAGTNASVTNSGTTSAAVFNFTIPRGDTGATGATGAAGPNSVTSATTSDGTGIITFASVGTPIVKATTSAGVSARTNGGTECFSWGAGNGQNFTFTAGTGIALNSTSYTFGTGASAALKTALAIASADITDFTSAVEAIAPNAVTSATTSDGTASLDISNLTLSQAITSGLQTKMTFTAQPTTVGDGQQIIWQWYNGGSPLTTAVIATEATSSNSDKLLFKTSESGSLATSLDLNNSLATFSGVVSSLGATYQTGSTFTYNGSSAATHRTALGLTTLATTTPAANVATFIATPTSANLAAAVTDETGSGALVFAESPSMSNITVAGNMTHRVPSSLTGIANLTSVSIGGGIHAPGLWLGASALSPSTSNYAMQYSSVDGTLFNTPSGQRCFFRVGNANALVIGSGLNVGIGTASPLSSAALQIVSTTRGFLPPKMTTVERNAITNITSGLMVYNTTTNKLNFYNGSAWETVTSL
jgi:hypothetical protein